MPVAASQILDFLEQRDAFSLERHEIASLVFGVLRRSLRRIVQKLRESDDDEALEISGRLKALLSEWLTTPAPFDQSITDAVRDLFGDGNTIRSRWGPDIWRLCQAALQAAEDLPSIENPICEKLREVIEEVRLQGRSFKIYCHRRARPYFESLLASLGDVSFSESIFLHSVRDYRETETFDVLIKVGPLRSRGWGSAPDALLTAPRFNTLVLIVWSGCGDEPGFGYDPSTPFTDETDGAGATGARILHRLPKWTEKLTRTGEDPGSIAGEAAETDELLIFRETNQRGETRPAKLVQVDTEHGILYPPYSQVLSFSPISGMREPIDWRIPGETLLEGMFVIMPVLDEVDLGNLQARHGYYSQIWKARLEEEWSANEPGLVERLRAAGLDLMHLGNALKHWCRPPGTVIHAPQKITHFEILLRVLGIECDMADGVHETSVPWWKRAWTEIRRSRGEAIQAGVLEQELVEEQLLVMLRNLLPTIRANSSGNGAFDLAVPANSGMGGYLRFFLVWGIEDGFSVPEPELRTVNELSMIDLWRD